MKMVEDRKGARFHHSGSELSDGGRIIAAVVLVSLVAISSTSRVASGPASDIGVGGGVLAGTAALAVLAVAIGGGVLGGYGALAETRSLTKLLAAVVAGLALMALIAPLIDQSNDPLHCPQPCNGTGVKTGHGDVVAGGGGHSGGWSNAYLIAGGGLLVALVLIVGAMLIAARRRGRLTPEPEPQVGHVAQAVEESIDDLRREHDVRRAIIACYARMERALEASGHQRRPQEAPFEFLARILGRIASAAPALRSLTELFETAKFSIEPMGLADKELAITALEELRKDIFLAPGHL